MSRLLHLALFCFTLWVVVTFSVVVMFSGDTRGEYVFTFALTSSYV